MLDSICDTEALAASIRQCRICRDQPVGAPLVPEPNPILVLSSTARVCIAGQAPGNLADRAGRPFADPSGRRLREWMGVDEVVFYDPARISIVPMGFCFPGYDGKGGDRPPRRECRAAWHDKIFAAMPQIELVLAVGQYAQAWHLHRLRGTRPQSLGATVADWRAALDGGASPRVLPLPHPSWRNTGWLRRHPWFADELLPVLKRLVAELV